MILIYSMGDGYNQYDEGLFIKQMLGNLGSAYTEC
jgi:hypothetical protein